MAETVKEVQVVQAVYNGQPAPHNVYSVVKKSNGQPLSLGRAQKGKVMTVPVKDITAGRLNNYGEPLFLRPDGSRFIVERGIIVEKVAEDPKPQPVTDDVPEEAKEVEAPSFRQKLQEIPGIGPKSASDIINAGYETMQELMDEDQDTLAEKTNGSIAGIVSRHFQSFKAFSGSEEEE